MAYPGQLLPEGIPSEEGLHLLHVPSALVPTGHHMDNTGKINEICFYNKKNQTVEIIKLNGSIELAPIVGLSEVICDIVETGSTLKENGLEVLEEVCPLSARMIVNPVSMQMEADRIRKLVGAIREQLKIQP